MNLAIIKSATLIVCLLICSIYDIRKKEIPVWSLILGGAAVLLLSLFDSSTDWLLSGCGAILGVLLLILSRVLHGAIGVGDGLIVLLVGFAMGIYGGSVVLFYSLFLAAIVSIVLLCCKKLSRKDSIPFTPFVLICYVGVYLG